MAKKQLEIACFNPESAQIAQASGADRIELCDGFEVGGTTPSAAMIRAAKTKVVIDLYVMIRPRGGDFVYNDDEFSQMKTSISELKKEQVDGFVFGILNEDRSINIQQNKELIALAKPLPCTFHRAFDLVADAFTALEEVIGCGFSTVLTSGQKPNVNEGSNRLGELVKKAAKRIVIMPGGGLRSSNITEIGQQTGADWFHSSAITQDDRTADAAEIKTLLSKLKTL